MDRRQFTKNTLLGAAVVSMVPGGLSGAISPQPGKFKKGIMWGTIQVGKTISEKFEAAKNAGFDGVEAASHLDRQEVLKAMKATGLKVHSVCGDLHWKFLLSDPDPSIREKGADALKVTVEDAKTYGSDTVLLVREEFLATVRYDECWSRSVEGIKKVLPLAEKYKIKITIENVWNNFLLSPMEAVSYVDQFKSPYVGFYLDCGNILNYGWPEQWIRILGKRIAKIHIKEFSQKLADTSGKSSGFKVKLLEGDVNWPEVIKALKEIGYDGWMTLEQPGGNSPDGLKDLYNSLERIISS